MSFFESLSSGVPSSLGYSCFSISLATAVSGIMWISEESRRSESSEHVRLFLYHLRGTELSALPRPEYNDASDPEMVDRMDSMLPCLQEVCGLRPRS